MKLIKSLIVLSLAGTMVACSHTDKNAVSAPIAAPTVVFDNDLQFSVTPISIEGCHDSLLKAATPEDSQKAIDCFNAVTVLPSAPLPAQILKQMGLAEAYTKLADTSKNNDGYKKSIEIDSAALTLDPGDKERLNQWILDNLGYNQWKLNEKNAAIKSFNQAITLSPRFEPAYKNLIALYSEDKTNKNAADIETLKSDQEKYKLPLTQKEYQKQAYEQTEQRHGEAAVGFFKKFISLDPWSSIDYIGLAHAYADFGVNDGSGVSPEAKDRAVFYYSLAAALNPSAFTYHRLGWANQVVNYSKKDLIEDYKKSIELDPNQVDSWSRLWAALDGNFSAPQSKDPKQLALQQWVINGLVAAMSFQTEKNIGQLQEELKNHPHDLWVRAHLADAYYALSKSFGFVVKDNSIDTAKYASLALAEQEKVEALAEKETPKDDSTKMLVDYLACVVPSDSSKAACKGIADYYEKYREEHAEIYLTYADMMYLFRIQALEALNPSKAVAVKPEGLPK